MKQSLKCRKLLLSMFVAVVWTVFEHPAFADTVEHDGFFLEGELGLGYVWMRGTAVGAANADDKSVNGTAIAGGILLGNTMFEGLVVGAATQNHSVWSPRLVYGDETQSLDGSLGLSLMGPFVQYYPEPKEGLFVRAMPGYAVVYATDSKLDRFATGLGVAAAMGNEWWISREWSMGVAGRLTYANITYNTHVDETGVERKYNAFAPSVLLTLTLH